MTSHDKNYLDATADALVGCSASTIRQALEVAFKMGRVDKALERFPQLRTESGAPVEGVQS